MARLIAAVLAVFLVAGCEEPVRPNLDDVVVALYTTTPSGDALVGSGVVIDRDGGILMAAHMTNAFPKGVAVVVTNDPIDGEVRHIGRIMWSSNQTDLAYIHVDAVTFPAEATIASGYETGDAIEIVGHPRGVLWIHTKGYIAGEPKPDISPMGLFPAYWTIPMDATVAPGNSGGGVFNEAGELVAIVSWAFQGPMEATGSLSFATPSDVICRLLLCR